MLELAGWRLEHVCARRSDGNFSGGSMTEVTDVIVGAVLIIDTGVSSTDKITSNGKLIN